MCCPIYCRHNEKIDCSILKAIYTSGKAGGISTDTAETGLLSLCSSDLLWLPSDPAVSPQRPCQSDFLPLNQGDSAFFQTDGFASLAGKMVPVKVP